MWIVAFVIGLAVLFVIALLVRHNRRASPR
jgi:hypothetical protein